MDLINGVKTHSPLFYLHVVLQQGARFGLPNEHSESGIYIAKGSIEVSGYYLYCRDKCWFLTKVLIR